MTWLSQEQLAALQAPLARENVKPKKANGPKGDYIEAWHAIMEANRIFEFDGWDREMVECRCVMEREAKIGSPPRDGWRVGYIARVKITVHAGDRKVVREGSGYGSGIDSDVGAAHESALKECESDAMKRALVTFGNPFGLALYDKEQTNVETPARPKQQPATASQGRTLSQIRDAIHRALSIADTVKIVDDILMVNQAELALIKGASGPTHARLVDFAEQRKMTLAEQAVPSDLVQKLREGLTA
jgi:DNA repair and recombination protein RAD52